MMKLEKGNRNLQQNSRLKLKDTENKVFTAAETTISGDGREAGDLSAGIPVYRELIDGMNDTVWVIDLNGDLIDVNKTAEETLGYTKEEFLKMGLFGLDSSLTREDICSLVKNMPHDKIQCFETSHKAKNGDIIPVEISSSLINYFGQKAILSIARDISERKHAEDALKASEERYRLFINATKDMAFLKDEKFQYLFVNDALSTSIGMPINQIIGKQDADLMPEKAAERCRETDLQALSSDTLVVSEEVIGDIIYETNKFRVPFGTGNYGIGGYIRNVTEKRLSEIQIKKQSDELKELNATKDKFFSIIAHDLKGPFNSILGFSDLLLENYRDLDGATLEKSLQAIHMASNQAYALLENLLLWSQAQIGRVDYFPEAFYLNELMLDNIRLLKIQANKKNIFISSHIPGNLKVLADRNMVGTILRNLMTNAIKFTPRNGKIEVSALVNNQQVEISVADNGIGIPRENIGKVFRIDSKISTPGTEKERGSGLGLLICKEFVEKNGGRIWVERNREKGSTFRFTVPV